MGRKPGQKPHLWSTGTCPIKHDKFLKWHQQRNQAQWRGETWAIDFEEFCELWAEHDWDQRGRKPSDLCMVRKSYELNWTLDNVHIVTRAEHWQHQHQQRRQQKLQQMDRYLD